MGRLFQILAVVLGIVAGVFFWFGNTDGLFLSAVAGAVCFFLSVRFQVKERNDRRASENSGSSNES